MSWSSQFRQKLFQTGLFSASRVDEKQIDALENLFLESDVGFHASEQIIRSLRQEIKTDISLSKALKAVLMRAFDAPQHKSPFTGTTHARQVADASNASIRNELQVALILGVNGVGKTTSIGKLAYFLQQRGHKVVLAAGDTFRAAARDQLSIWAQRNQCAFVSNDNGDPAGIFFDAIQHAKARDLDVVLMDTAGRLPTQVHLIEELKKIQRVAEKALSGAPQERILVLDATTGQNMLAQIKAFDAAVNLTGLLITKMDGTAKGGALLSLIFSPAVRHIPIYFLGQGEGIEDLTVFDHERFIESFLPLEN